MKLKLMLVSVGVGFALLTLLALEVLIRSFGPEYFSPLVTHAVLNHTWRPYGVWTHSEYANRGIPPYVHRYNGEGWIGAEDLPLEKRPGTFRVFYVGDSFTEGTCPTEDSLSSRVADLLTPHFERAGMRLEVINTGTMSYSPVLYYLLIKTVLLKYSPDLIVVNVDMTDVFDDYIYSTTALYDREGELLAVPPQGLIERSYVRTEEGLVAKTPRDRLVEALREHSRLFEFIYVVLGGVLDIRRGRDPTLPGQFDWALPERTVQVEELVQNTLNRLERVVALARENGVRIALTAIPHLEHFERTFSERPMEEIAALCERLKVPYIDSLGGLRTALASTPPREIYIPRDMHFNPEGYRLWAEVQAAALLGIVGNTFPR